MVSQAERVYNHLQVFGFITNEQAHTMYGFRHLPAIIRDIKKQYNAIFDEEWMEGCNRFGEPVRWKKYILKPQEPKIKFWELDK